MVLLAELGPAAPVGHLHARVADRRGPSPSTRTRCRPTASIALSGFVPSPDGAISPTAARKAAPTGRRCHVRGAPDGGQLPDTVRWVKFSGISWTKDGKGFFYGRYPEPPEGKELQAAVRDKKLYYHVLGTPQSADRAVYERPDEPTLFIGGDVDETGRYLFIVTNKGTEQQERAVREGPRRPDGAEDRRADPAALHGPHRGVRAARRSQGHAVRADRPRRAEPEGGRDRRSTSRTRELEDASCPRAATPSTRGPRRGQASRSTRSRTSRAR